MREKQEKVTMVKSFASEMSLIHSQISNYEDNLREFKLYKKFLEKVTPKV
jgi:hypothetical protein